MSIATGHRSFLTESSFTTENESSSDSCSSDSDSDIVSQSAMYRKLRKDKPKKGIKELLERDKKQLEHQQKKLKSLKEKVDHQKYELLNWEKKLIEHKECREEAKRILKEANAEHEQQMMIERKAVALEKKRVDAEMAAVTKDWDQFEKGHQLNSKQLELGLEKIGEMEARKTSLEKIIKELVAKGITSGNQLPLPLLSANSHSIPISSTPPLPFPCRPHSLCQSSIPFPLLHPPIPFPLLQPPIPFPLLHSPTPFPLLHPPVPFPLLHPPIPFQFPLPNGNGNGIILLVAHDPYTNGLYL